MYIPPQPDDLSFAPGQPVGEKILSDVLAADVSCPVETVAASYEFCEEDEEGEEYWESGAATDSALDDWKSTLRDDFESWLDALDEIPTELGDEYEPDENPDLSTVFGDLSSLALENRKSNRRTTEAFSQWNTVLTGFQDDLKRLRERERVLLENQPAPESVPPALAAFLVDFHDRLTRLAQAQSQMPTARLGFFGDDAAWKTAWQNQRSALDITLSHLQTMLKEQGFQRIQALGQPLDPTRMAVIETRLAPGISPHTVIAETAPGWLLGSRVLRPAQVVVAISPPVSPS